MKEVTLSQEERQQLAAYVERCPPGTPYRRRAQILLLADEGKTPTSIAPEVGLPARQVRLLFRAFRRQRVDLFPRRVLQGDALFAPQTEMAEAGRRALARQLAVIREYDAALRADAEATAVHETRKAIRRTRTLFSLLKPYFAAGAFRPYRRCLKETMRALALARDLHIYCQGLAAFCEREDLGDAEREAVRALHRLWQAAKEEADEKAREAAARPAYRSCLDAYETFLNTPGAGVREVRDPFAPRQVRHQATVHVYRRLAAVRAFEGRVATASVSDLHRLRILFKKLRYTLEFFEPVLGPEIDGVLAELNGIQDHLGELNDARVALALLAETEGAEAGAGIYRAVQEAEMKRLVDTFKPVWDTFSDGAWRQKVAAALSVL